MTRDDPLPDVPDLEEMAEDPALDRREFLARLRQLGLSAAAGAGLITAAEKGALAAPPGEKIVLGVMGIRGRGSYLALDFATRGDCEIAYLCDCDTSMFDTVPPAGYLRNVDPSLHIPRAAGIEKAQGKPVKCVTDFRTMLDDGAVDAVVIATPDHWHSLAGVMACQAGKDVYVEKPISQSPWEGRKLVEAARKHGRIVQCGTQSRSAPSMIAAKKYIDEGKLGAIHMCRVYNQKHWANARPVPDGDPPRGLNWDVWKGPAPDDPYNVNLHRRWHHFWRYSGGDTICDPIHQLDLAHWFMGQDYPKSVYAVGGRFVEDGVFETPDTLAAVWDFDEFVMTFEVTLYTRYMLKADSVLRASDMFPHWPQYCSRIELYGTRGLMMVGRHGAGWQVFARPHQRKPVVADQMYGRWPDKWHKDDFCDAVRTRRLPNSDVAKVHLSHLLPQWANISYRVGGQKLVVDPKTESFANCPEANALIKREYRKPWVVPEEV